MSLLKNIRLSSASKQCARAPGGPQRLVYVVSAADKDKHASAVPPTLRQRCPRGLLPGQNSVTVPHGLTDELRAQGYPFNVKTVAASLAPSGTEGKGLPEVQPGQLPRTRPACVRKSVGAGFLRQWPDQKWAGDITYLRTDEGWAVSGSGH
ncbi:IS3 element protein InsF [Escherichia coli]|nr:IS3 element protein InsF [Escherichia coli]